MNQTGLPEKEVQNDATWLEIPEQETTKQDNKNNQSEEKGAARPNHKAQELQQNKNIANSENKTEQTEEKTIDPFMVYPIHDIFEFNIKLARKAKF